MWELNDNQFVWMWCDVGQSLKESWFDEWNKTNSENITTEVKEDLKSIMWNHNSIFNNYN